MISTSPAFLILADESAGWKIAGLPQLDRLVLGLNEWAEKQVSDSMVDAVIFWKPGMASGSRWLPRHPRIKRVRLSESLSSLGEGGQILDTRLFVQRDGLTELLRTTPPVKADQDIEESLECWMELRRRTESTYRSSSVQPTRRDWKYLERATEIARCDKELLYRTGKSQDGLISRVLNRPVSRALSRFLLKYEMHPTTWTLSFFVLPIIAFFFLSYDDYTGIVIGAAIFQIYSMIDGCDGEIARATYLESERGGRIDDAFDMIGSVLYVVGLGFGLLRSRASFYALEGIVCAGVIVANEWFLRRVKPDPGPDSAQLRDALYPRHRRLLAGRKLGRAGEKFLWWLIQATKRDAAIVLFLILAILDRPQWILHLWLIVSSTVLILSARSRTRDEGVPAAQP